ncbi:MAG: hypothetical protein ABI432_10205 [Flavobacteriales bacterium]
MLFAALGMASFCNGQTYFSTMDGNPWGGVYRATDWCEPQLLTVNVEYLDITVLTDRRLLGYRLQPAGFCLIDTITGAASPLGAVYSPYVTALETESDTTVLFAAQEQPYLYRLNLLDLSVSTVGNMGYNPNGDLLLLGDALFFAATGPNALLRIELSADHQAIDQVITVGLTAWNLWGLALPSGFQDEYPDCVLATAGQQLYALNTITAEMTQICDAISTGTFSGAATFKGENPGEHSTHVSESGPCSWSQRPGTLFIGEEGLDASLKAWLPSTHTILQWSLFDAVGRYVAGERGPTIGGLGSLTQGLYILRCVVQDPCGHEIFVPGIRLHM